MSIPLQCQCHLMKPTRHYKFFKQNFTSALDNLIFNYTSKPSNYYWTSGCQYSKFFPGRNLS